jgi:hypothetical protein
VSELTADAQRELISEMERRGRELCEAVQRAEDAGVPPALLLPALMAVFREAGMLPDAFASLDLGALLGSMGR